MASLADQMGPKIEICTRTLQVSLSFPGLAVPKGPLGPADPVQAPGPQVDRRGGLGRRLARGHVEQVLEPHGHVKPIQDVGRAGRNLTLELPQAGFAVGEDRQGGRLVGAGRGGSGLRCPGSW